MASRWSHPRGQNCHQVVPSPWRTTLRKLNARQSGLAWFPASDWFTGALPDRPRRGWPAWIRSPPTKSPSGDRVDQTLGQHGDPRPIAWGETAPAALATALDGVALLGAELHSRGSASSQSPSSRWRKSISGVRDPTDGCSCRANPSRRSSRRDGKTELHTSAEEQLLEVVAAIDEPQVRAPLFGQPARLPG